MAKKLRNIIACVAIFFICTVCKFCFWGLFYFSFIRLFSFIHVLFFYFFLFHLFIIFCIFIYIFILLFRNFVFIFCLLRYFLWGSYIFPWCTVWHRLLCASLLRMRGNTHCEWIKILGGYIPKSRLTRIKIKRSSEWVFVDNSLYYMR